MTENSGRFGETDPEKAGSDPLFPKKNAPEEGFYDKIEKNLLAGKGIFPEDSPVVLRAYEGEEDFIDREILKIIGEIEGAGEEEAIRIIGNCDCNIDDLDSRSTNYSFAGQGINMILFSGKQRKIMRESLTRKFNMRDEEIDAFAKACGRISDIATRIKDPFK